MNPNYTQKRHFPKVKIEQLFQAILIKTFQRGWKLSASLVFCLEHWGKSPVCACVSQYGVDTKTSVLPTGWKLLSYAKSSRETQQTRLYFHRPKYNKELIYRCLKRRHMLPTATASNVLNVELFFAHFTFCSSVLLPFWKTSKKWGSYICCFWGSKASSQFSLDIPPTVCVCVKARARGSNCFLPPENSRRWTFEWNWPAGAMTYLFQFAWGGRNDLYPEANVNAFWVIVQNKRKLKPNIKTLI